MFKWYWTIFSLGAPVFSDNLKRKDNLDRQQAGCVYYGIWSLSNILTVFCLISVTKLSISSDKRSEPRRRQWKVLRFPMEMKSYQRSLQAHVSFNPPWRACSQTTLATSHSPTWLDYLLLPQYFLGADSSAYRKIPIGNGVRESFRSFRPPSWLGKFQLLF